MIDAMLIYPDDCWDIVIRLGTILGANMDNVIDPLEDWET